MCDHPPDDRTAYLGISIRNPDGTTHTRTWHVCPIGADEFAATLGPHLSESIATAEAKAATRQAYLATPGIVRIGGDLG
ncbi:hypothetical protein [Sphaerimonospora thailandensis]|uniref:Uncharacterized protein n=1 Tax=Sphaerimonospora thailandensis TaxID=795644 RepID=A0A8J3R811_9ACTN|nr:hypothetical protein [Sphaerimonospora thailandensis]GIH69471.1 hypothetical protein Mth01_17240 [Sphaerimonospora thailandensis]